MTLSDWEKCYCFCGNPLCEDVGYKLNSLFTNVEDAKKCTEQINTLRYVTFEGRFLGWMEVDNLGFHLS